MSMASVGAFQDLPGTLGELRRSGYCEARVASRSVKDELRENLIAKLERGEELFPGIVGYEDTVIPQLVNAVLSRHNFILLGLRGQAKTRIIRMLTSLMDEFAPCIAGTETRDNPYRPISRQARLLLEEMGEETWTHSGRIAMVPARCLSALGPGLGHELPIMEACESLVRDLLHPTGGYPFQG